MNSQKRYLVQLISLVKKPLTLGSEVTKISILTQGNIIVGYDLFQLGASANTIVTNAMLGVGL